ncbi:MAG TPA: TetR/AcrR family transcriptional regulator [Actinophytocola sp.]|uniref:TetR/AcrR family transcriptional regulator n=1 Tax=Actinophytocola sp. TaxID=1872138 RepID=UPI002DDC96D4|nr:TetR/AcrR family transcriptional regulator [Actinophytocola sp.]HEV2781131.1 TetR/AcrR family transcriptional regulator [Actinophytocola sp.]
MDGRSERWRAHRVERRAEFVDAALRALEKYGPEVAVAQIAAEAGVAKPRLYRHFDDKADLFRAVQDRISTTLWQHLTAALNPDDAPAHLVRHGLDAFLSVVDEHPNTFRLMMAPGSPTERALEDGKKIADVLAALIAGQLATLGVDTSGAEPWGHALAGAVGGATHWWLEHRSISKQQLIDHLSTVILGSMEGIAKSAGVVVDLDEPIKSQTMRTADDRA